MTCQYLRTEELNDKWDYAFIKKGNPTDNQVESWPCRQDVKLPSPLTHSQVIRADTNTQ